MVWLNELFLERKVRKRNLVKKNRKGQIESIGLVFIVVILVLLFIFFLYIKASSSTNENAERVLEIKANNLRNSILKTTLCNDINVNDEILNCNNGNGVCGSCDELKNSINDIIARSLEPGIKYEFKPYNLKRGVCGTNKIVSSVQPLEEDLDAEIGLCY